jgi:hypothetical protein
MKRVLVTAGTVYGPLDANKLVGNRIRGIWATRFARYLAQWKTYDVTLLLPDIYPKESIPDFPYLKILKHEGFWDYQKLVLELAPQMNAAVMAAAVVNWIPETPYPGKMPTQNVGKRWLVPFILAPRVIDQVKMANPNLTLIGCKMTVGARDVDLIVAARDVIADARCTAVVANDMLRLKHKLVAYPDGAVFDFTLENRDSGDLFFKQLKELVDDDYFRTTETVQAIRIRADEAKLFDAIVDRYRKRFVPDGRTDHVLGSLAVRLESDSVLMSPRKKGNHFSSKDGIFVRNVFILPDNEVVTCGGKATRNAPLLFHHLNRYPEAHAVLHLHEQLDGVPTVPYAPPGSVRDSVRDGVAPVFNIDRHGFVAALDAHGEFLHA